MAVFSPVYGILQILTDIKNLGNGIALPKQDPMSAVGEPIPVLLRTLVVREVLELRLPGVLLPDIQDHFHVTELTALPAIEPPHHNG